MTKKEIDDTALQAAIDLEEEYFDTVIDGVGLRRAIKKGKTLEDFNDAHAIIWRNHEATLINEGYLIPRVEPEPPRDIAAEIDAIKSRLDKVETTEAITK